MGRARKRGMTTSVASSGRRARRRPGLRHLAYLVIAALGVVICMAALELSRLFADAGSFELVALEVDGLRLLTGDDVLVASGLELGTDLFDVDLAAVSAATVCLRCGMLHEHCAIRVEVQTLPHFVQEPSRIDRVSTGRLHSGTNGCPVGVDCFHGKFPCVLGHH